MIKIVKTKKQDFSKYKNVISPDLYKEILFLSKKLKNKKINHLNSAPEGGGVAEILKSLVPLMRSLGLDARWYVIEAGAEFFDITKNIHNGLQGSSYDMPLKDRQLYLAHSMSLANDMKMIKSDAWIVHDPQPLAISSYIDDLAPSVAHIHIDLSSSNARLWNFFYPFFLNYDHLIFSSSDYVKADLENNINIFPPAIDAFSIKNKTISTKRAKEIVKSVGLDINKPIISQVSRFDYWKNPLGVIDLYYKLKKKIPDIQLILLGVIIAQDDPEAFKVLKDVKKRAGNDKNIHIFSDLSEINDYDIDLFVSAVQKASDLIIQNSIKEGFGLTVTEAMWKKKVVLAGNVGGIKLQINDSVNGFLANNANELYLKSLKVLKDKELSLQIGERAYEKVVDNFLMPRLLRDYLLILNDMLK